MTPSSRLSTAEPDSQQRPLSPQDWGPHQRTIERHLAELKAAGRLRREGAPKNGRWMVVQP
jgi:predicted HTH transcriptional regulator